VVYFVQSIEGGPIKIGTTVRLTMRLQALANEYGLDLRVLAVTDGSYREEKSLHRQFSHLNVEDEWFEPGDDLLEFIIKIGRPWDGTDERPTEAVRVKNDVLSMIRVVASFENKTIADYISDTLRPIVERDFARHIKKHSGKVDPA
jgi:hypothetical protein